MTDAPVSLISVGMRCRCPRCGKGALYAGYMRVVDRCSVCGLELAANDSGDGPAVFLIFLLGFTIVPVALLVSLRVAWPLWLHAILWGPIIIGATIGLMRPAKALTIALQYRYRRDQFDKSGDADDQD